LRVKEYECDSLDVRLLRLHHNTDGQCLLCGTLRTLGRSRLRANAGHQLHRKINPDNVTADGSRKSDPLN